MSKYPIPTDTLGWLAEFAHAAVDGKHDIDLRMNYLALNIALLKCQTMQMQLEIERLESAPGTSPAA